jgi:hypothetical protein
MHTQLVPVQLDGVALWVEAAVTPGSQETSTLDKTTERMSEAFDSIRAVLSSLAKRVVAAAQELREEAMAPSEISAEFGLKLATTGQVILVSGTAEASLNITLTYKP